LAISSCGPVDQGLHHLEFFAHGDQRDHDLRLDGLAGFAHHLGGCLNDGAGLHLVDLGIGDGQAAAAVAQHGIGFREL
jgi:hypothetical protein